MPDSLPAFGPRAPEITMKDLLHQFWADIYGKEVQQATTYSYTWMADQMGHVCIGIVLNFGVTLVARYVLPLVGVAASWDEVAGLVIGVVAVSLWEWSAFHSSVKGVTGHFPLDRELLRNNAIIAAVYMIFGVGAGFAFHQDAFWGVVGFVALTLLAVVCAPPWLRQKIIWQKAALPYLFRLADLQRTVGWEAAQELQALIDQDAPPTARASQVLVGGPIGSGRTSIAASIGTEFAFKKAAVRYLGFDALLELAAHPPSPKFADDTGPENINYWRWSEAQVVIIDDIGPMITADAKDLEENLERFRKLLHTRLHAVAPVFAACHTVWVIGDLRSVGQTAIAGDALNEFAQEIALFCDAKDAVLVVELSTPQWLMPMETKPTLETAPAAPAQIRRVAPRS